MRKMNVSVMAMERFCPPVNRVAEVYFVDVLFISPSRLNVGGLDRVILVI